MVKVSPFNLASTFMRLNGHGNVEPLPVNDSFWQRLSAGELGQFHNEFLVSFHTFDSDWGLWEMHPNGDEVVCLLSGEVTFVLEQDGNPPHL